jgi:hypothetical protein
MKNTPLTPKFTPFYTKLCVDIRIYEKYKALRNGYFKGYAEIWKVIRIFFRTQLGSHAE